MSRQSAKNQQPTITRRNALKAVGVGSIGLTGVGTVLGSSKKDTVTITIVEGGDGTPRLRKEVPANWYEREMRATDVQWNLRKQYGIENPDFSVSGIDGVGLGTLEETISGRRTSYVEVYVDPVTGTDVDIPSGVNGIPVETAATPRPAPDACNQTNFDPMPGGVMVGGSSGQYDGTATCEVKYGSTFYMMTAAHLFTCNGADIRGEPMYQNTQYVGDVEVASLSEDWALIPRASNSDVDDFDNQIEDQPGKLSGHVSRDGLLDLKSTGETVYKQGVETCETSGVVEKIEQTVLNCNDTSDDYYVQVSTPTSPGDSGSPHFHKYIYNGCYYLAIIAPHYGGESVGCAAYHLNKSHGIEFDPEFSLGC